MNNFTKSSIAYTLFLCVCLSSCGNKQASQQSQKKEKTVFQTGSHWKPELDNRGDVAIIYGVGGNPSDNSALISFEDRVKSWRDKGYTTHFMTGIAWGEYKDYFTGEWDGVPHLDEGQVDMHGDTIWHGHLVPYIVPSDNFLKYLKEKHVKRVIDAGIDAIYMEEPEFWSRAGYSTAFKKEWKDFYGFEWRPQHQSPENTYLSNKLKYHLYYKAINEVFTYAKEYGKTKGMDIRCYIPTHSLVNYSQWQIVSPEASLSALPCVDGYIAQIWTGTSREPNLYNGLMKERVFETAFLEYGSMESMTAPTGRKMFFLTDPIEDRAKDWEDYKKNYQATFVAQLLYPQIADYEIMPWPERIYEGLYRTSANSDVRERIPGFYSTQMQVMINSLNSMPLSDNEVTGSKGISVLMANSLMFQRFPVHSGYEDPQLANFYGQALPFLKRGIPVNIAHIENLEYDALKDTKVLLMTYSNMKPMDVKSHDLLAKWVENGGVIVYNGRDDDPFQSVQEWWNTGDNNYMAASDDLFEKLGIGKSPKEGEYKFGKGAIYVLRHDPKEFVLEENNDKKLVETVKHMYQGAAKGGLLEFKNNLYLQRGPYELIAVLDESVNNNPYIAKGLFIDLFDPELPILSEKVVNANEQSYLFNINKVEDKSKPQVLAAASRIYDEKATKNSYSFKALSPVNTTNVMRVLLPKSPSKCNITDKNGKVMGNAKWEWDEASKTSKIVFDNSPEGVFVNIEW